MRAGGVPVAALLLVFASLLIQASTEDIYWEGEEEASNEFLEVKEDDSSLTSHLKRIKRDWFDVFNPFASSSSPPPENYETATNVLPDEEIIDEKDDDADADADGSGSPNIVDAEPGEKTLRVSFVVMQPYQKNYSNRDSQEFQNFSKSLANAVNKLYEGNPDIKGTQRASLVRIQSRATDDFSCKVTLDIVTTGYDNMDVIKNILRDHIRYRRALEDLAVSDADFSAKVIDPARANDLCTSDEIRCDDGYCVPRSAYCDGRQDCSDGADEANCPVDDITTPAVTEAYRDPQERVTVPYQPQRPEDITTEMSRPWGSTNDCRDDQLNCDVTRCVELTRRCDGYPDCDDRSDEINCGALTPANLNTVAAQNKTTHCHSKVNSSNPSHGGSEVAMTMELVSEIRLLREEVKALRIEMHESRNATITFLTAAVNMCNQRIDGFSTRMDAVENQQQRVNASNVFIAEQTIVANESDANNRNQQKQLQPVVLALLRRVSSRP